MGATLVQVRLLTEKDSQAYLASRRAMLEEFPVLTGEEMGRELAFIMRFDNDVLANHALEGTRVWGAFDAGMLLGVVCATRFFERSRMRTIRIWGLYVDPAHRGGGIGSALMQAALGWSRRQPMAVEALGHASLGNRRALRMIRRHGFVRMDDRGRIEGLCELRIDLSAPRTPGDHRPRILGC